MDKKVMLAEKLGKFMPGFLSKKLKNPVFIIGSGRSGTSMLNALLKSHQSITSYLTEANELWHPTLYPYHNVDIDVSPIWIDPVEFTKKSLKTWPDTWGEKIRAIFAIYQIIYNKPVFINKTVMANFMLDKVLESFPDAKFIYMVRNGWSVALSYQKKEVEKYIHQRYEPYKEIVSDESKIRLMHAKYWNEIIKKVETEKKRLFNDNNFLELKYEDLVENPADKIGELLRFIDLPMGNTPKFKELLGGINNRNYKAGQSLSKNELDELSSVMSEGLALKGYKAPF